MRNTTDHDSQHSASVRNMFDRIARRYVLMNTLMTFGRDRVWRKHVVRAAHLPPTGRLLDIATGTGDIALQALRHHPQIIPVGGDFSLEMMRVGQMRSAGQHIRWCATDALRLPFADETFDAVTSGFLIRNLPAARIVDAFAEQARVLKVGGRIVCLDTSPPPNNMLQPLINLQFKYIIPTLGKLINGDSQAYTYLPSTTVAFKTPHELADLMRQAGLHDVSHRSYMLNTIAIHVATRA